MRQKRVLKMIHDFVQLYPTPSGLGKGGLVGRERAKEGFAGKSLSPSSGQG